MRLPEGFEPFEPARDAPQLPEAECRNVATAFEWWYFDLQTEDGVSLVVVLNRKNPVLSASRPAVYVEYADPDHSLRRVRTYARSEFGWHGEGDDRLLTVGPHRLRLDGADAASLTYTLELRLPGLEADLTFRPLHRGFLPGPDGRYFHDPARPSRRTCVSFSAPMMRVVGTVRPAGAPERTVHGRGYHDHPWGTVQLFQTHAAWSWGRVSTDRSAVMFARVEPARSFAGHLSFYYEGTFGAFEPRVSDGIEVFGSERRRDHLWGIRFPHRVRVTSGAREGTADCTGSLLDTPIYNRSSATWTDPATPTPGKGWVEDYRIRPWSPLLVFWGARLAAFFWRPFPFFGR